VPPSPTLLTPGASATLDALRQRIRALERPAARTDGVHPFGIAALDGHLPEGGLAAGALHEIAGGGPDAIQAAAATLFIAGILARLAAAPIVWCAAARDLFPPGLVCAGLDPARILHTATPDEKTTLLVMEEALRHPGLAAVVGELTRLPMVASRRLALAAEKSGTLALALRRRREGKPAEESLSAAATRWCVTPHPSASVPGERQPILGRALWHVALTRCRGGEPATWILEACDAQGYLAVPAPLEHRQGAAA
jgi:protein ImuA